MQRRIPIMLAVLAGATLACNAASLLTSDSAPTEIVIAPTSATDVVLQPTDSAAVVVEPDHTALEDNSTDALLLDDTIVATPMIAPEATISPQTAVPFADVVETAAEDNNQAAPPNSMQTLAQQVFGDDLPVKLEITSLDVETSVVAVGWRSSADGVQWDSPKNAAGFVINSAAPGTSGNTVLYGHNNIEGEVFKNLSEVVAGDQIKLTASDGSEYLYEVEEVVRFQERGITDSERLEHLSYFDATDDQRLTLLTCWPYTGNSHRVAVVAKPVG